MSAELTIKISAESRQVLKSMRDTVSGLTGVSVSLKTVTGEMKSATAASKALEGSIKGISSSLKGLLVVGTVATGFGALAKSIIGTTVEFERYEQQLYTIYRNQSQV